MSKTLIVDDNDPSIQYTGGWTLGGAFSTSSHEHLNTIHQSSEIGDSLSYTFEGVGISVYGTVKGPISNNGTLTIDSGSPTMFNSTQSIVHGSDEDSYAHTLLYKSPDLTKGVHTLSLNVTSGSAPWIIDFLTVDTGSDRVGSASTSANAPVNVILDDRDPGISYSPDGAWRGAGAAQEYLGTTSRAPRLANLGTATFKFNGTEVAVYATAPTAVNSSATVRVGFTIDGVPGAEYDQAVVSNAYFTPFFHIQGLDPSKEHTLVATTLTNNIWFLDYIVYTTSDSSGNSGISGSAGSSGSSGSGATAAPGTSSTNTGAIAGGVVAGVVGLLAIAMGIFFFLRRRGRGEEEDEGKANRAGRSSHLQPFVTPGTSLTSTTRLGSGKGGQRTMGQRDRNSIQTTTVASTSGYNDSGGSGTRSRGGLNTAYESTSPSRDGGSGPPPADVRRGNFAVPVLESLGGNADPKAQHAPRREEPQTPIAEIDSGIRIPNTVPPAYTED